MNISNLVYPVLLGAGVSFSPGIVFADKEELDTTELTTECDLPSEPHFEAEVVKAEEGHDEKDHDEKDKKKNKESAESVSSVDKIKKSLSGKVADFMAEREAYFREEVEPDAVSGPTIPLSRSAAKTKKAAAEDLTPFCEQDPFIKAKGHKGRDHYSPFPVIL